MIDHYDWPGGREALLRFGPATGPVVLVIPALFEEHNRTRAFAVSICRALAGLGLASILPDLPGQNESTLPTEEATLEHWRAAMANVAGEQPFHIAAIRGGAILGDVPGSLSVWRLSPMTGQTVLRDLERSATIGDLGAPGNSPVDDGPVTLAGNAIGASMVAALRVHGTLADPIVPLRTVRLADDTAVADVRFPGAPLWRRAEPGNDETLAQLFASDIAAWIARCGG